MTSSTSRADPGPDYLTHLASESARFLAAVRAAAADAAVPTCPGWDAQDLLWHLGEVQWFWGEVVRTRATDPDTVEAAKPARPANGPDLEAFFAGSSARLGELLAATGPDTPAWTWSTEPTVGFIRRRQAHEAMVHRLDAELAAGTRTALDPALAADGVDELLRVMFGDIPSWGSFTVDAGRTVRVSTTDTGHSWLVTLGRFTGTSPNTGTTYDDPAIEVAPVDDGAPAAATLTGTAEDLDCALWNRPPVGAVERSGDPQTLDLFDAQVAAGIQ
jgi:uncharacterized protein (TIGR03083 family)